MVVGTGRGARFALEHMTHAKREIDDEERVRGVGVRVGCVGEQSSSDKKSVLLTIRLREKANGRRVAFSHVTRSSVYMWCGPSGRDSDGGGGGGGGDGAMSVCVPER